MSRPRRLFVDLSAEESGAALAGKLRVLRRPVARENSLVGGWRPTPAFWPKLDFASPLVRVDPGPSPAGNAGPYLHVPQRDSDGIVDRVYPAWQPGEILTCREPWTIAEDHEDALTLPEHSGGHNQEHLWYFASKVDKIITKNLKRGPRKAGTLPVWGCRSAVRVVSVAATQGGVLNADARVWNWEAVVERAEVPR